MRTNNLGTGVLALQWMDKTLVSIHDNTTVTKTRRTREGKNHQKQVVKPLCIDEYGYYMAGVDKSDHMISYYGSKPWSGITWQVWTATCFTSCQNKTRIVQTINAHCTRTYVRTEGVGKHVLYIFSYFIYAVLLNFIKLVGMRRRCTLPPYVSFHGLLAAHAHKTS